MVKNRTTRTAYSPSLGSFGTCYFLILLRSARKSLNLSVCIHLLKTSGSGLRVLCDFRPSTTEVNITIKLLLVLLLSTVEFCCLSSRFGGMIDMESVEDVANISNVSRITTHSLQLYSHCWPLDRLPATVQSLQLLFISLCWK